MPPPLGIVLLSFLVRAPQQPLRGAQRGSPEALPEARYLRHLLRPHIAKFKRRLSVCSVYSLSADKTSCVRTPTAQLKWSSGQCVKGGAIGRLAPESRSLVASSNFGCSEVPLEECDCERPSSTPCHSAIRRATSFRSVLISFLLNQLEITKDIKPEPRFRPSPFCANPHETCAFCTCPQKNAFFPVFLWFRPCVPFPRSL